MTLILASASPRRSALLQQIGAVFTVENSQITERVDPFLSPADMALQFALQKATAVAQKHEEGLVLGADTVVVIDGDLLGKPSDSTEAMQMLRRLSGRWHQVMTAVAIVDASGAKESWTAVEKTNVKFRHISEADIAAYVKTGESMDKAGAYGIQGYGALLVERIEGCYFNVVGLPLQRVAEGLQNWGLNLYEYRSCLQNERISEIRPSERAAGDGRG